MRSPFPRFLSAFTVCCTLLSVPASVHAAQGDCGQPVSTGTGPTASDALIILKSSVGQATACDAEPCICDANGDGNTVAGDALLTLRIAVGQFVCPGVACPLLCNCEPPFDPGCTSARITTTAGDLDYGWNGLAHDSDVPVGGSITVRIKSECSGAQNVECRLNNDCAGEETCEPTCDCTSDTSCEITGPTHGGKCLITLADCETNRCIVTGSTTATACTSNADCGAGLCTGSTGCASGEQCVSTFGPPLPLAAGDTAICVVSYFHGPLTGTMDTGTGQALFSASLKARVHLSDTVLQTPCPVCGSPENDPDVGEQFTCVGGQFPGASCTVEGVTPEFGGTSSDCPPPPHQLVSTLAIRLGEITTGTATETAKLPCKFFGFEGNPLVPGSDPKCLDKNLINDPVCTSNADCKRCTDNSSISCTTNAECAGNGLCAESPDQPVTCGFWCHCGLCGGDPAQPCFENSECAANVKCIAGPGIGTQPTAPQTRSNLCNDDHYICGSGDDELCETTLVGRCSEQDYRSCEETADCSEFSAGTCVFEQRPCFEPRITRTGEPSPLGRYCAFEDKACNSNADCMGLDDLCVLDASRLETVALFCVPASSMAVVNNAAGIMGPGALTLQNLVEICRCGDAMPGCDEQCDDGNAISGDGCDELCRDE